MEPPGMSNNDTYLEMRTLNSLQFCSVSYSGYQIAFCFLILTWVYVFIDMR